MDLIEKLTNMINKTEQANVPQIFPKKSTPYILFAHLDNKGNFNCYGQYINNKYVDFHPPDSSLPFKCFETINILLNSPGSKQPYPEIMQGFYDTQEGTLYYALATIDGERLYSLTGYYFIKIFDITSPEHQ